MNRHEGGWLRSHPATSGLPKDGERAPTRADRSRGRTDRARARRPRRVRGGGSNRQIAYLRVSEQAVKYHLTNIYRKLDTANRVETLIRASDLGLVDTRAPVGV